MIAESYDNSATKTMRIAIVGDFATQFVSKAISESLDQREIPFELYEAEYNQMDLQFFNPNSGLHKFNPQTIVVALSGLRFLSEFVGLSLTEKLSFAETKIKYISECISQLSHSQIILFNFVEQEFGILGNYANKVPSSYLSQVRTLNHRLMMKSQEEPRIHILDIKILCQRVGENTAMDRRMGANFDMPFSLEFTSEIGRNIGEILAASAGRIRKCLVLDLDNTLWGGVIGDDGLEGIQIGNHGIGRAFRDMQLWAKSLKDRGIILAVSSKNEEELAREPFEKHKEMVLKIDDITVFMANWESKASNIEKIQRQLNIGLDSIVFIDDNPFERDLVRQFLPEVFVPELPNDPVEYVPYLASVNLFEAASFSNEDLRRSELYKMEVMRTKAKAEFASEGEYLASLKMVCLVTGFDTMLVPRVSQLTMRSNQFNLRTKRYSEEEIRRMAGSQEFVGLSFSLSDKFGDHGLVSVVILHRQPEYVFIDTWLMSCRVLNRGLEFFVLNKIVNEAKSLGLSTIVGEYLPTQKNKMVQDLYTELGFERRDSYWYLSVNGFSYKTTSIKSE